MSNAMRSGARSWGCWGVEVSSSPVDEEQARNRFSGAFGWNHLCTSSTTGVLKGCLRSSGISNERQR